MPTTSQALRLVLPNGKDLLAEVSIRPMPARGTSKGSAHFVSPAQAVHSFSTILPVVEGIGTALAQSLARIAPDEASVEFGLSLALESGALTAVLAKGSGTATLAVTLTWKRMPESDGHPR